MVQTSIAIVADCDDTLAPDTTGQLLQLCGVDSQDFFQNKSAPLVREGWDPSLAYMHEMIRLPQPGGPLEGLTCQKLTELAGKLNFYPGLPDCFQAIKQEVKNDPDFRAVGVRVESCVVSGGIAELLRASLLRESTYRIWGCDFSYDSRGVIAYPKNAISFTDKTRFLYRINKGLTSPASDSQPYSVNQVMTTEERPVPFENMIYLGDGPSDIPCMFLLSTHKGFVIGVANQENPNKTWALSHGRRANQTVDPDFTAQGLAFRALREAVLLKSSGYRKPNYGFEAGSTALKEEDPAMSIYASLPTTDQLLADALSSVGLRHRLRGVSSEMDLVVYGDRIVAYRDEEDRPVAIIRFGGPYSGTIWVAGELVGEYEKDQEGEFLVTEIEAGFKQPNSRRKLDPVSHLVELAGGVAGSKA